MTDIVKRLRSLNADFLYEEAADEIERLRAEVHKLSTTCGHCGDLERAWTEAAVARREGIEACLVVLERWGAWSAGPDDYGMPPDVERLTEAHAAISALLEGGRCD